MCEPDHLASTRAVYDHSAAQYVAGVGTAVSAKFEAPLDRAVLDAFAESVRSREPEGAENGVEAVTAAVEGSLGGG